MQTLAQIRELLTLHGLAPKKSLGQNFLCDHNLIRKLVAHADVGQEDLVLEIGPGTGALTDELVDRGAEVIACEMDQGLAGILHDRFGDRITLIHADCLASKREINPSITDTIDGRDFKLVANLPYNAGTPLMLTLAIDHANCTGMWVTIQKELAERFRAPSGTKTYGEVSVIARALFEVSRVATLPPGCFWPQPSVTSEMIALIRRDIPLTVDRRALAVGVHKLFAERRKQLGRLFPSDTSLPVGIERSMRAEQLTVEQAVELAQILSARD